MQIAVLGDDDFVTGFQLAGVKMIYPAKDEELEGKVAEIMETEEIGVLVMKEEDYEKLTVGVKKKLDKTIAPVIVTLAGTEEKGALGELIKKCVGVDLWKE